MTEQYLELKIEELEKRIKTLEQEPCDAISREAVLKLCTNDKYNIPYEYKDDKGIIHKGYDEHRLINYYKLKYLPSVTPSRQWIPVSERLPEDAYGCLVTVYDTDLRTQDEFENILPYFVGYDGETWNNADGETIPFEVIAWMPLPKPYGAEMEMKNEIYI